jgi:hypothetical protein
MSTSRDLGPQPAPPPFTLGADYLFAVVASWLMPGGGHFLLGQRPRALLLAAPILGLFWLGQGLSDWRAVNRDVHPIFFCGQVGNGGSALLANHYLGKRRPNPHALVDGVDDTLAPGHNTGILFTTVSGLLNMLLVLHVADPQTWRERRAGNAPQPAAPGSRAGKGAA